jgi:hypothetical protein
METSDGMLIATILMAVFAGFSLVTSIVQAFVQTRLLKKQQISQENLLNKQNEIQQKQLQLALLKEKQEIREDFRRIIITKRNDISDVVYRCKTMSLEEFRDNNIKDYVVFMRLEDLFGQKLKFKADEILRHFENILSLETQQISELGLFKNGWRHPEVEKGLKQELLETYKSVYEYNTDNLVKAKNLFSDILQEMNNDINQIAESLQNKNII